MTCQNCGDATCTVADARAELRRVDSGVTYHPEAWDALHAAERACAARVRGLLSRAQKAEAAVVEAWKKLARAEADLAVEADKRAASEQAYTSLTERREYVERVITDEEQG